VVGATLAACLLSVSAGITRDVPTRVVQGEVRCRVLLIDFEGREHVHPRESFETLFFGQNVRATPEPFSEPMCGSVRDFFSEISNGRLQLVGEVMPWVRSRLKQEELPHWSTTRDGNRDWWQPVVSDAMSLNNIPKDDRIGGKPVDFYAVIYAGSSHGYFKCLGRETFMGAGRRSLSNRVFGGGKVPFWEDRWNGKQITFNPERWRREPSGIFGMGLICHELGHMLCGFWDLYGQSGGDFGDYAVMAYGEKTHFPTGPVAFHRYMAGWLAYDVPEPRGRHRLRLPPLEAQRAVKLVNGPMPWADALVVENRVKLDPRTSTLPAEGLLIYEAYGNRRVRVVRWDAKAKKPSMYEQRLRLLRADGSPRNEPGDVFRQGQQLTLFGNPSSASSATGCGYWELGNILLPTTTGPRSPSAAMRAVATFDVVYLPRRVAVGRGTAPVSLARDLSPGDHRIYVQVVGGGATLRSPSTALLELPAAADSQPTWGLLDVHVPAGRPQLTVVPGRNARIAEIQIVPRRPVLLNLLASPQIETLASSLGAQPSTSAVLAENVYAGSVLDLALGSAPAKATLPLACPGGVLRLALRAYGPRGGAAPTVTLTIGEGGKPQKYLGKAPLATNRPEFFLVDCHHQSGKPVQLALTLDGPPGTRVILWEAAFAAE